MIILKSLVFLAVFVLTYSLLTTAYYGIRSAHGVPVAPGTHRRWSNITMCAGIAAILLIELTIRLRLGLQFIKLTPIVCIHLSLAFALAAAFALLKSKFTGKKSRRVHIFLAICMLVVYPIVVVLGLELLMDL